MTKNLPKVSVVVPVYNTAEKYLSVCLKSVFTQTFSDFEVLLIDDGSTDDSGARCDSYAERDARVRVFHKPNGGVSSARNFGLKNARGEFIAFLDADDLWADSFLEKTLGLAESFPNLDYFAAAHDEFVGNGGGIDNTVIPTQNASENKNGGGVVRSELLASLEIGDILMFDAINYAVKNKRWGAGGIGSVLFRTRAVLALGGFDETLISGEDGKFHFEMALRGRVVFLNEILMHYRLDVPASSKKRRQMKNALSKAWVAHLDCYDELLKTRPAVRKYLDALRVGTLLSYRGNKDYKAEIKSILSKVSRDNWTLPFRVLYALPPAWTSRLVVFYRKAKHFFRK